MNVYAVKSRIAVLSLVAGAILSVSSCGDRQRTNPLDPDRPGAEEGFGLTAVGARSGIELKWSDMRFPKFDRYVIYRRLADGDDEFAQVATSHAGTYQDTGLVEIIDYQYRISVIVDGTESRRSNPVSARPLDAIPPTVAIITPVSVSTE